MAIEASIEVWKVGLTQVENLISLPIIRKVCVNTKLWTVKGNVELRNTFRALLLTNNNMLSKNTTGSSGENNKKISAAAVLGQSSA